MFIHPNNPLKEAWDLLVLLFTLFLAVEIPLGLAMGADVVPFIPLIDTLATLVYVLDIVLSMNTAYFDGPHLITDKKQIRSHYLKGWFTIDALAAFPFFLFTAHHDPSLFKVIRILQLPRLFKLSRLNSFFALWQKNHFINPSLYRLLIFSLSITLAAHWLACSWILIGGVPGEPDAQTTYSKAVYWVITTLTTVGYGDITPSTNMQRYFTMMVMVAGVGSYGVVFGNIASFLANMDIVKTGYKKKLEEVDAFLKYKSIPPEMKKRVHDYYRHIWDSRMGHDESRVLHDLPLDLREDLALFMRRELIRKVPFFQNAGRSLLKDVVLSLKPAVYLPGAWIMKKGEQGDVMYIVSNGSVEVTSKSGREVYASLGSGSFVGEMSLVTDMPRTASVRASDYCDMYMLTRADFNRLLKKYPEFDAFVRKTTADRLKGVRSREKED